MRHAVFTLMLLFCFALAPAALPWPAETSTRIFAQEVGFLEDFVLAKDRDAVLKQLRGLGKTHKRQVQQAGFRVLNSRVYHEFSQPLFYALATKP